VEVGFRGQPGRVGGGPGHLQEAQRLGRGVFGQRELAGGQAAGVHLPRRPGGFAQRVVAGRRVHGGRVGRAGRVQDLGEPLVQPAQRGRGQLGQQRLPDAVVQEPVPVRAGRRHQPAGLRLGQRLPGLPGLDLADGRDEVGLEPPAGRRASRQQVAARRAEPVDALEHQVERVAGQLQPVQPGEIELPAAPPGGDQAGVDDRPHVLDDGERVAADPGDQFVDHRAGQLHAAQVERDQVGDRFPVQRAQRDAGVQGGVQVGAEPGQHVLVVIAGSRDDQQRGVGEPRGHLVQYAPGRAVEPLHVVEVQHGPFPLVGQPDQERGDGVAELLVAVLLAQVGRLDEVGQQRRQGTQERAAPAGGPPQATDRVVAFR
jgi:hypothetical protein